jgi:hypothetical protein
MKYYTAGRQGSEENQSIKVKLRNLRREIKNVYKTGDLKRYTLIRSCTGIWD